MNAVEKLQAAIERLEELKAKSTPGPWQWWGDRRGDQSFLYGGDDYKTPVIDAWGMHSDGYLGIDETDAELIVTLHRTIDAQLAILRDIAERYRKFPPASDPGWEPKAPSTVNALALADAILGES